MQMKKTIIVLLVLIILLTGLFIWKGFHHAIHLSGILENWLDEDNADQMLTIEIQQPGQNGNTWALTLDTFWTQNGTQRVYGMMTDGITAYLSGKNLYLDNGKAYALPDLSELKETINRLKLGLLLYGRVTKRDNTYQITMNTKELDLLATITINKTVRSMTINAVLPDETVVHITMTTQETQFHQIPESVLSAMEQAESEPPISLTEPLDVLLPASEKLLPLAGDLKMTISCGFLELSESMALNLQADRAVLSGNGQSLEMPIDLSEIPPFAMAALLLRDADFSQTADGALFTVIVPSDAATALLKTLVPQAADLGITLSDSTLILIITEQGPRSCTLTAKGWVPFMFSRIPVNVFAKLTIT